MHDFSTTLYRWYHQNKRDLPWRKTKDPYKIWISEIILQQTRVAQGTDYYRRFVKKFPNIRQLAVARENEVLKLWQGLGYYSRARNLHFAAKTIINEYHGEFPATYEEILKLKGIGNYTAAAIASIAFSLPFPAIDGNVYRVLSRYFGIDLPIDSTSGKKEFAQLAAELIHLEDPGMHNQAMMEFGALQCVPKNPGCLSCPLHDSCFAFEKQLVDYLPVKEKKKKQGERFFYYYLFEKGPVIYFEKRIGNDIWKNLYQFPLSEEPHELSEKEILRKKLPFIENGPATFVSISTKRKHVLTHQIIWARVIRLEISDDTVINKALIPVNKKDISKFAVPRLLELFFDELKWNT